MSRILALAAAAALAGVTACNKPAEETAPPPPAQPAMEAAPRMAAESAPAMTEPAAPQATGEKMAPPAAAKPEPAKPAPEAKPAAPQAMAPAAKPEAPAAPAAPATKSGTLTRDEAMVLAAKGNCVACHKIESRLVGPAWQDVGAKYKNDPNAAATIASHIKSGGSFGWKFGVMPPRGGSKISDSDVESLAKFIAGLK